MNQKLTMKEIEQRYDSQWVLLGDPEWDSYDRVRRAVVLAHGPDKDKVFRKAMRLKPKSSAFYWIGEHPKVIAIV